MLSIHGFRAIMIRLFTTILLLAFLPCRSQEFLGTWYMVNRSGLIEFSITRDSIKTRQLFTDFTPKDKAQQSNNYIKMVKLGDRTLLISKSQEDTLKFSATALINLNDKKYFQIAWNLPDTLTEDIETLIRIHQNDHRQLLGYYVFSEYYIDSLKQMKPLDSLSLSDFKNYLAVYMDKVRLTEKDAAEYQTGYLSVFTYNFQLVSQALYDIGFNPLQNTATTEAVYDKYHNDPDVKKILSSLSESE